jgi:small conductance mechanosensitive channel
MIAGLVLAAGSNDAGIVEACGPKSDRSWLCSGVYHLTGDKSAAAVADALAKPIRIVIILLVAWIAVIVSRSLIRRFVRHLTGGVERLTSSPRGVAIVDSTGLTPEHGAQRAETIGTVLRSVAGLLIWSIALLTILDELGINLAPLLAGAGIAGIALGFGAQSLVRDFITGLFMLIEDQYGVGDVIDTGLATGTVEVLSLRTTRLRDSDGVVWHIPNGAIARVGNESKQWARAVLDVGVGYDTDLERATEVIRDAADELRHEDAYAALVLDEPQVLGIESMSPDRIVIRVSVRTRPQQQHRVARVLRVRVKAALDAAGIAVPSV